MEIKELKKVLNFLTSGHYPLRRKKLAKTQNRTSRMMNMLYN